MISVFIFTLAAAPILLMLTVFNVEMLLGLRQIQSRSVQHLEKQARTTIIMPAHNEALGIGNAVSSIMGDLPNGAKLLVVADNCSDETARIARGLGADVIERNEPERRGKGFALAFARDSIATDPPDVVIILDADCTVQGCGMSTLIAKVLECNRPVQAAYLLTPDLNAPVLTQISNFAFYVKNRVRQRALLRHSGGVVLTGTGMAFPWSALATAQLASDDLTEDLSLGILLTQSDMPPAFADDVIVVSDGAPSNFDTMAQRRRWEHGFVRTAVSQALPMIAKGAKQRNRAVFGLGLHLLVPPLTMLVLLAFVQLTVLWFLLGPGILVLGTVALLGLAAILLSLTWFREGYAFMSGAALIRLPLYIVSKLPSYAALLLGRSTTWVRTKRQGE
jgi:cellulose synthase/poly-beta-1,6-N-acetylglucosamine synthase-like glycosyltransferase